MGAVAEVADEVQEMPQHMTALEHANKVRLARAELKRRIAAGTVGVAEVLADVPWEAQSMPLMELLQAPKRWGRERSRRALAKAGGIPELKPVGTLTERQRRMLSAVV